LKQNIQQHICFLNHINTITDIIVSEYLLLENI